jgi:hypothetical protein
VKILDFKFWIVGIASLYQIYNLAINQRPFTDRGSGPFEGPTHIPPVLLVVADAKKGVFYTGKTHAKFAARH